MTLLTLAEQEGATKLSWLTGDFIRFGPLEGEVKATFIHGNLLRARCPSANFIFNQFADQDYSLCKLGDDDGLGFSHFLLWIYCDTIAHLIKDWEVDYVSAFRFAQKYRLPEFEEFLSDRFGAAASLIYGHTEDTEQPPLNPTIESLVIAATVLHEDSKISEFLIEQFIRSWIWRRAYSDNDFDDLVDTHPDVAKLLLRRTRDVARVERENSVAIFGTRRLKSPVHIEEHSVANEVPLAEVPPVDATEVVEEAPNAADEPASSSYPEGENGAVGISEPESTPVESPPRPEAKEPPPGYKYKWTRKGGKKRRKHLVPIRNLEPEEPAIEVVPDEFPPEVEVLEDIQYADEPPAAPSSDLEEVGESSEPLEEPVPDDVPDYDSHAPVREESAAWEPSF